MGKYDFELDLLHPNSVAMILQQIKSGATVLEFGPANGRMTKYLSQELGCYVYLVEQDPESGKMALEYAEELVTGDAENFEWLKRYQDILFDYIIFADVLEHLRDPQEVLAKSKILLKNEGSILFSVPNFAHNSILINLLRNDFQYRETGLLDNTHIHMFTKNSIENMLHDIELFPVKRMATYSEVGKNEIPADIHWISGIDDSFWNCRQYGEVYQYVYEVKKGPEYIEEIENSLHDNLGHYFIQCYMEDGGKLSEEYSIKKCIANFKTENIFTFHTLDAVNIRIDPINHSCIAAITCFAIKGGVRTELEVVSTNADYAEGNEYCFKDDDPWLNYTCKDGADQIEVHILYHTLSKESVDMSLFWLGEMEKKTNRERDDWERKYAKLLEEKEGLEHTNKILEEEKQKFMQKRGKIFSRIF